MARDVRRVKRELVPGGEPQIEWRTNSMKRRLAMLALLIASGCAPAMQSGRIAYRSMSVTNNSLENVSIFLGNSRIGEVAALTSRVLFMDATLLSACSRVTVRTALQDTWTSPFCSGSIIVEANLRHSIVIP
jgi:hypothetical protein